MQRLQALRSLLSLLSNHLSHVLKGLVVQPAYDGHARPHDLHDFFLLLKGLPRDIVPPEDEEDVHRY